MEKTGSSGYPVDALEESYVAPSAPPSYDDAMATTMHVHNAKNYEISGMQGGAPPVPPANQIPVSQQPIIITQNVGMSSQFVPVGPKPLRITCPHCHNSVQTRTTTKNGCCCKCCLCSLLFISGVCLLCSFLPFCLCTERVTHTCPSCGVTLGTFVS